MISKECSDISLGAIDPNCKYQFLAISKEEMTNLYEAHLRQDHLDKLEDLKETKLTAIKDRIAQFFK